MTTSSIAPEEAANEYKISARRFLGQAEDDLVKGDLARACENGYRAAFESVKAAATLRGTPFRNYRELRYAAQDLMDETDDQRILYLFAIAESLYIYGADGRRSWSVKINLDSIREFIEILERLPPPKEISQSPPDRRTLFIRDRDDWEGTKAT